MESGMPELTDIERRADVVLRFNGQQLYRWDNDGEGWIVCTIPSNVTPEAWARSQVVLISVNRVVAYNGVLV